jgi:hypothetical protein
MHNNFKRGFVYLWYDKKHKRYYVGCHWGFEDDGYICSSPWMKQAYRIRPNDFKRRILKTNIPTRELTYIEEQRWLNMIKLDEIKPINANPRYYNLNIKNNEIWHKYDENIKLVGEKISAAKTGKSTGPCSPEKAAAISKAKKQKFAERGGISEAHRNALTGIKHKPHTDEWKAENSQRMKEQWQNGTRKAKESLTEEHKKKIGDSQKGKKLSNEQIELLKKNNSKKYQIKFTDGTTIIVHGLKSYALENNMKYITLHKAFLHHNAVKKHKIVEIVVA